MRRSLRSKERVCLADRVKNGRRLLYLRRRASERSSSPSRRTVNIEYLDSPYTPDVRIHIVEIANSSTTTIPDIKRNESVFAKLKRHICSLFRRKDTDTRDQPGDETKPVHQPSRSHNDPQPPAMNEKPNRRSGFAFLRKFFRSQTEASLKQLTSSTSLNSTEQQLLYQNSYAMTPRPNIETAGFGPFVAQHIAPSTISTAGLALTASTANLDLNDWASLAAFPKSRLSGAKQTVACQMSPSAIHTRAWDSENAGGIEKGEIYDPRCNVIKWLEELQEPPCLRRVAAVQDLRGLQASHST
ncbi:hypothetical protein BDBG_01508 [Blastomyces gilchristii SLH14081]|uniref:Uncharacterized protein n=1 Tax=Blastomyces gilchristii (strain SLH14081) TaxID=559298 RepID=A0A179UCP3_BLAGS|nr:uncharacterized protein BDBG_01508 [Blastomyces gilchristii SLH14081]OAT05059.1 hypothetical protein BDBG_01508 [Blastomyces gilchristii SLH14081]